MFYGCEKEETHWEQPLDPKFLEYVYFKKGTWWVYEDTVTHYRDSQYVVYDSIVKSGPALDKDDDFGVDKVTLTHYEYDVQTAFQINPVRYFGGSRCGRAGTHRDSNICYLADYDKFRTAFSDGPWACTYFCFRPILNSTKVSFHYNGTITNYYKTFNISEKIFPVVYLSNLPKNPQENDMDTRIWVSKNHGIIRKAIRTEDLFTYPSGWQVWDLVNYHIVQ